MIVEILVGLVLLLILYGAMAPLESLRWWSRRGADDVRTTVTEMLGERDAAASGPAVEGDAAASGPPAGAIFLVYLSGIGVPDGTANSRKERAMLDAVHAARPEVVLVADIFPYSVTNQGLLTGERINTWLWKRLKAIRSKRRPSFSHMLINVRNVFQMFVSADPRYGPTYNVGIAQEIWRSLGRHGYTRRSGSPVVIVGYSGGGQVALGAAWYLGMAGIDVSVVTLGGMLSDDPGLDRVRQLWHLYGSKDWLQGMGHVLFPGRWRAARLSSWNRALDEGRIHAVDVGPMTHDGRADYFDARTEHPAGGTHADATVAAILTALESITAASPVQG